MALFPFVCTLVFTRNGPFGLSQSSAKSRLPVSPVAFVSSPPPSFLVLRRRLACTAKVSAIDVADPSPALLLAIPCFAVRRLSCRSLIVIPARFVGPCSTRLCFFVPAFRCPLRRETPVVAQLAILRPTLLHPVRSLSLVRRCPLGPTRSLSRAWLGTPIVVTPIEPPRFSKRVWRNPLLFLISPLIFNRAACCAYTFLFSAQSRVVYHLSCSAPSVPNAVL